MGLLSNVLFDQAWVDGLKHIPEMGMVAQIEIYDPELSEMVWNNGTNEYETSEGPPLYTGKARVQPLRSAGQKAVPTNSTSTQTILFSIPIANKALDLKTHYQVRVLEATLNPALVPLTYVISEFIDSSNPLEKTFYCTTDQELRRGDV